MLTGTPPLPSATLAELRPDLPVHVGHAVARALSRRPNDRYPGILDFLTAMESGGAMMVDARPSGRASELILTIPGWEPPKQDRPRWVVPAVVTGILAVAGAVTVFVLTQRTPASNFRPGLSPTTVQAFPPEPATGTPPVVPIAPPTVGEVARRQQRVEQGVVDLRANREPRPGRRSSSSTTSTTRPPDTTPQRSEPAPAPAPVAPAPAATAAEAGRLFVNASPWGQLFVDGQLVGNTPKANLSVSAGTHTIRVARDGFEPIERTIRVGAGETVRLTDLVLTPRP
jgi:hypothetical protein